MIERPIGALILSMQAVHSIVNSDLFLPTSLGWPGIRTLEDRCAPEDAPAHLAASTSAALVPEKTIQDPEKDFVMPF